MRYGLVHRDGDAVYGEGQGVALTPGHVNFRLIIPSPNVYNTTLQ